MNTKLLFYKYHGAGNDFIIINNLNNKIVINELIIQKLCHRRFGIGADGLILLSKSIDYTFKMDFFNSDGSSGIMCGNGARCLASFALETLELDSKEKHYFETIDGVHELTFNTESISISMHFDSIIKKEEDFYISQSKSAPHAVVFVENTANFDVYNIGKKIRERYDVNVNFITVNPKTKIITARTFERGVEDETLACGTGAVSIAMVLYKKDILKQTNYTIQMPGGTLTVSFDAANGTIKNIKLTGEAKKVFKGEFYL